MTEMGRIRRKEAGWEHLFEVPGLSWEVQTDGLKAMHVTIPGNRHIVVYAYDKATEFNVVTYKENQFASEDNEQWMGPMEALCIVLEAQKERDNGGHGPDDSADPSV